MPLNLVKSFIKEVQEDGLASAVSLSLKTVFNSFHKFRIELKSSFKYLRHGRSYLAEINGYKMLLDLEPFSENFEEKKIALKGFWDKETTYLLSEVLKNMVGSGKKPVFCDIGANTGYYTLLAADILGSDGKVFSVEPHPDNISKIRENIGLNGFENIEVVPKAVGNSESSLFLSVSSNSAYHEPLATGKDKLKHLDKIEVEQVKVDKLLEESTKGDNPLVLKIDVQGYESEVLKGSKEVLESGKDIIVFIELHERPGNPADKSLKFLEKNGFKPSYMEKKGEITSVDSFEDIPRTYIHVVLDNFNEDKKDLPYPSKV